MDHNNGATNDPDGVRIANAVEHLHRLADQLVDPQEPEPADRLRQPRSTEPNQPVEADPSTNLDT